MKELGFEELAERLSSMHGIELTAEKVKKFATHPSFTGEVIHRPFECEDFEGYSHRGSSFGFLASFSMIYREEIIQAQEAYESDEVQPEETVKRCLNRLIRMSENPSLGISLEENHRYSSNII